MTLTTNSSDGVTRYILWKAFDEILASRINDTSLAGIAIISNVLSRMEGEPLNIRQSVKMAIESGVVE